MEKLKNTLDKFYKEYNFKERVLHDPIEIPHQYKYPEDIEVSAFISSCLAYGKIDLFKPVIKKILEVMGKSPYDFLLSFDAKKEKHLFSGIRYRFNDSDDIVCLLYIMSVLLKKYGTVEKTFKQFYKNEDTDIDIGKGLSGFVNCLLSINTSVAYGRNVHPPGLLQFFPSPVKGSACKRANLFLRWMVRDRDLDFGIWKGIPENKLIIPLDTHIAKISRCLRFTRRTSPDWKMAVEITESLKMFDPEDPLKYDFALCHHGISGLCASKKYEKDCSGCSLVRWRS